MNLALLFPPVWLLLSTISMIGLHLFLPIEQLFSPPVTYIGIGMIAIGIITIVFCAYSFRQNKTAILPFKESSHLIKKGIFKYSRNPIYLGMIAILTGVWIYLGSLTPLLIIPLFSLLIQEVFIKEEERMLEDKFGEDYRQYKATVRRWI